MPFSHFNVIQLLLSIGVYVIATGSKGKFLEGKMPAMQEK
jgi:hypothetical protein